jgi:branched-chain amino acid transport system ATP-binding protein
MKAITDSPLLADRHHLGKSIKGVRLGPGQEGLAMVPEGRGVFTRMTITETADGAYIRNDSGGSPKTSKKMFNLFPTPARAQGPAGRHHVPAASSRCWPWAAR